LKNNSNFQRYLWSSAIATQTNGIAIPSIWQTEIGYTRDFTLKEDDNLSLMNIGSDTSLSYYRKYLNKDLNYKTAINIADSKWHYVAMTLDEQNLQLYVDGSMVFKINVGEKNFNQESGSLMFGRLETGAGDHVGCNGTLDEIRISNLVRKTLL
jgi:hypothetical protein